MYRASANVMEQSQMGTTIKTEEETPATSTVYSASEIDLNDLKQEPGSVQSVESKPARLVKKEIEENGEDDSEQQCAQDASAPVGAGSLYEANSQGDWINVKPELDEMDIGPTVLQHMDIHYALNKSTVDGCSKAMRSIRGNEDQEDKLRDSLTSQKAMTKKQTRLLESLQCAVCEQQLASVCCVHVMRLDVFQCDLCHAVYTGKYRLLQHLQAVHAYRPQNSLIVKFGKTYKRTTTDNKTISQTCDQKTTKLEYDEVHMKSQLGQHKDLQKHLLDQHCTTSSNGLKCERTFRKPVLPRVHNNLLQRNSRKAVTVRGTVASRSDQSGDKRTKTKQKPFQCDVCKKGYSLKAGLNLHTCSHSSVKLKNDLISYESHTMKKCYHCHAKFAQNGDLKRHMSVHAGETSYSCKMCDARFAKINCLTQHMSVHTGPKPYKCKICDTRFAQSTGLIRHMRLHTGEKPYQCKICNIRFAQSSHLTQHMRVHTGEKPYQCKICDAKFAHSTVLTQHIRLHTGEKPYQCKICDTRFAQSSHLTRHMGIHAAVKLYQCKICDASFARSGHLTKHARVHTNVNR